MRTAIEGCAPKLVLGSLEWVNASAATLSVSPRSPGAAASPRASTRKPVRLIGGLLAPVWTGAFPRNQERDLSKEIGKETEKRTHRGGQRWLGPGKERGV